MDNYPVSLGAVAKVLSLIHKPPNERRSPTPKDQAGDFDIWFDGGAAKIVTGWTRFQFSDGTVAETNTSPGLNALIRFPNGREIAVAEKVRPNHGL
jgi:hypothetical protein